MGTLCMRGWSGRGAAAALVLMAAGGPASAIVIRSDRTELAHIQLGSQPQFQSVGTVSLNSSLYASAVLIAPGYALTAAHVGYDQNNQLVTNPGAYSFNFGGEVRTATAFNIHPLYVHGLLEFGYDLAVVQLSAPVNNVTPAVIHRGRNEVGNQVTSVGYGLFGYGAPTGSIPGGFQTGTEGTRRAGTNVVDLAGADYVVFWSPDILLYDFDDPTDGLPNMMGSDIPLDMEDQIAPGDSGGGTFMMTPDGWELVGIHSFYFNNALTPVPPNPLGGYGFGSGMTRVSGYLNFIESFVPSIVPAPGASVLLAIGLVGASRRRR